MRPSNAEAIPELKSILKANGIRAALIYLNRLTALRFSALYRFQGETLKNSYFYDRENPEQESSEDIPVTASYCVFIRDAARTFTLADSLNDERVQNHAKRRQVRSYCGVPLLDENGEVFGSICHFDLHPTVIKTEDVELLESVGRLLKTVEPVV